MIHINQFHTLYIIIIYIHNTQDPHSAGPALLLQSMEEIAVSYAHNIPSINATASTENGTVETVFNTTRISEPLIIVHMQ